MSEGNTLSPFREIDRLPSTWEPTSHIWQAQEWLELCRAYKRKIWLFGAFQGQELAAYALLFIPKPYASERFFSPRAWINYFLFKRLVVLNGPVVLNPTQTIESHKKFCQLLVSGKFRGVSQVRVAPSAQVVNGQMGKAVEAVYIRHGFALEESYTFLLTVNHPLEKLWSGVHPKRRNRINRAKRDGVQIEEVQDESGLRRYWEMRKENWTRNELKVIPFSHFSETWQALKTSGSMKLFISKVDGQDLAGQILFLSRQHIQLNGVTVSNYNIEHSLGGNDLLQWHVIEWANQNNFIDVDYGGATPESEDPKEKGIHRFKASFGGAVVRNDAFVRQHKGPFQYLTGLALSIRDKR